MEANVYVGRLSAEKGLDVLLDAYERVLRRPRLSDIELLIAGEGEEAYVAQLAARAGRISLRVKFLGVLDTEALARLLSGALLSVVPSLWYENVPNSMLESLAAGTPLAASDLGCMAEVLHGTDAGFLFRPRDSGDRAEGLISLLLQPDTIARMSRSARVLAETRYGPGAHLNGLLRVLERAVDRNNQNEI